MSCYFAIRAHYSCAVRKNTKSYGSSSSKNDISDFFLVVSFFEKLFVCTFEVKIRQIEQKWKIRHLGIKCLHN